MRMCGNCLLWRWCIKAGGTERRLHCRARNSPQPLRSMRLASLPGRASCLVRHHQSGGIALDGSGRSLGTLRYPMPALSCRAAVALGSAQRVYQPARRSGRIRLPAVWFGDWCRIKRSSAVCSLNRLLYPVLGRSGGRPPKAVARKTECGQQGNRPA